MAAPHTQHEAFVAGGHLSNIKWASIAKPFTRESFGSVISMTRSFRIVSGILIVVGIALAALAFAISRNAAPALAPALRSDAVRMDAIVYRQY
ncbi:MAG TPA: hypothetical protein VII41_13110, partial [Steroidobacteraceae bacterium]